MKTLAQLTKTQQAAYKALLKAGKLESGQGFGLRTMDVLAREGFVEVKVACGKWTAVVVLKDKPGAVVKVLDDTSDERTAKVFTHGIHAKCNEVEILGIRTVMCGKSKGHASDEHYDPSAELRWRDDYKPAKKPNRQALVRLVKNELNFEQANMPEQGGFTVSQVLWDMVPVFFVGWAYDGAEADGTPSNMVERRLSEEVRAMAWLFESKGYAVVRYSDRKNHFFVVPEDFRHTA